MMLVLISHAVEDEPAAAALKEMIRRCSLNKIEVWFSSDRTAIGGMPMGGPWFNELSNKLKETDWIVAVVTPQSIVSPWLYFECGFGACNRTHSVIPLTIGLPVSNVPMPLAAYQIYDAANATSLETFLQKLLAADNVHYDDELTKGLRQITQRRMIEHQSKMTLVERKAPVAVSSDREDISALRSFIEQRFFELYEMIPTKKRPTVNLEVTFDASEFDSTASSVTLNVPSTASVLDVLDEVYLRIEKQVDQFSYLVKWIIDTKEDRPLSLMEMARRIPANAVFSSDRKYKIKRLRDGDKYIQNALRILRPK
jgi:TIR domain